jgi:hypothetical protein
MVYDVAVIGGGAAGMMAAGIAGSRSQKVVLLEKNPVLGKKLRISGKGRCNITNECEINEILANIPRNGKFMINALHRFDVYKTIKFFEKQGLHLKTERGRRVFPVSDDADDVVRILESFLKKNLIEIINKSVQKLWKEDDIFYLELIDGRLINSIKVILATGGVSYPATGSTGDGFRFARSFGHEISKLRPSLIPLISNEFIPANDTVHPRDLQGLSLKNIRIRILDKSNKEIYGEFGEMLFTHFGVSGPVILSASAHLETIDDHILEIDLKPALDDLTLENRLLREFKENPLKHFCNVLGHLLPSKLIPVIIALSEIDAQKQSGQITKEERKKVLELLKRFRCRINAFRPIKEAIITRGGINVREIDPKTMESRLVKGLYFAGEILDLDAFTGGFNLQIAWSTGFVAGNSV